MTGYFIRTAKELGCGVANGLLRTGCQCLFVVAPAGCGALGQGAMGGEVLAEAAPKSECVEQDCQSVEQDCQQSEASVDGFAPTANVGGRHLSGRMPRPERWASPGCPRSEAGGWARRSTPRFEAFRTRSCRASGTRTSGSAGARGRAPHGAHHQDPRAQPGHLRRVEGPRRAPVRGRCPCRAQAGRAPHAHRRA